MRSNFFIVNRPLSKREKILLLFFIICIILWGFYFILNPKLIELLDLKKQLHRIKSEKLVYTQLYDNPKDYKGVLEEYDDIVKKIPKNKGLPEFLISIEDWAIEENLSIISIYPKNYIEDDVNTIIFEITLSGDFISLLDFLSKLENHSRSLHANRIKFKALSDLTSDSSLSREHWELLIELKLYYLA